MPKSFHPGQRWISESEPELGLGEVQSVSLRRVSLSFGASKESREYMLESAPLRRVVFRIGDKIRTADGRDLTVQAVAEGRGLLHYDCGEHRICETELSDMLGFGGSLERFFAGRFDPPDHFDLRLSTLRHQYQRRKSEVRGFQGGRMDLLPHQISIASEVTGRLVPRVLLADEVGLGKTIEACLILHRLLLTGRAHRVLILVPESLQHQWFLELLRRFNLWFRIFDEERCQALEASNPGVNPFLDEQLLICELGLFTRRPERLQQALAAGWDVLVVDEAHHLGWAPGTPSAEYAIVEALGRQTPSLLLLTATPEQLGMAGHFARLRLLDPDRFFDLAAFLQESEGYLEIARLAEKLKEATPLSEAEEERLASILKEPEAALRDKLRQVRGEDESSRNTLIEALLDQHGTGRVMFRNTRATVAGFPKRIAKLQALKVSPMDADRIQALAREWAADSEPGSGFRADFAQDPRIDWLAGLLQDLGQEKVLLICRTQRKAEAIEAALKRRISLKMAVFHEGLSLIQRDRGAAWFAEEKGARLLICSEIGSEGRNFQFAHHLVLFDLPLDPSILEQRVGRLDRIGQHSDIHIHVPFVLGSHMEVLARWHAEGLNAFEEHLQGGQELQERFEPQLRQLIRRFAKNTPNSQEELERLIAATRKARKEVATRLEQGRDRLLEWNSFRPEASQRLVQEIRRQDADRALDNFLLSVLEHFFIEVEELAPRTYQLGSAGVLADAFPGLSSEGLTITGERSRALAREDLQFLTWDHPLVTGAMDLMLSSGHGNSSFARWPDAKVSGFYLESIYMLECIAPPQFHLDRFLPPTPLRVLLDHRGQDVGRTFPHAVLARLLKGGEGHALMERPEIRERLLPRLLEESQAIANTQVAALIEGARQAMSAQLGQEIARLQDLQKVNRSVRDEEIELLIQQRSAMEQHISEARLRLDALRFIQRAPIRR